MLFMIMEYSSRISRSSLLAGKHLSFELLRPHVDDYAALVGCTAGQRQVRPCCHRGLPLPNLCLAMDISADLHELTRCPVGLVSAGVKSILDIGR